MISDPNLVKMPQKVSETVERARSAIETAIKFLSTTVRLQLAEH